MDLQLTGSRVLVTGGTRGIGRAIVEEFVAEGAVVEFCARDAGGDRGDREGARRAGGPGRAASSSTSGTARGCAGWVETAAERLGGLDAVVANISALAIPDTEENWYASFEVDLMHTVRLSQAALPYLEASSNGSIVAISSVSGREADFAAGPYGTMKTAIVGYISGLAFQLAGRGMRANVVSPGNTYFEGGVWQQIEQGNPDFFTFAVALNPTGRMGTPAESREGGRVPGQPGVEPHHRHAPGRRRRADPGHPALTDVLGRRALGRATLARQLLLDRVRRPVARPLEHLVGLQAQVPRVPHLALWDRLTDYDPAELDGLMTVAGRRPDPAHADDDPHRDGGRRPRAAPAAAAGARPHVLRHRLGSAAARPGRRSRGRRAAGLLTERPLGRAELQRELGRRHRRGRRGGDLRRELLGAVGPAAAARPVERDGGGGDDPGRDVAGHGRARWPWTTSCCATWRAFGPASVRDIQAWCGLTRLREVVDRSARGCGASGPRTAPSWSTSPMRRCRTRRPHPCGSSPSTTTSSCRTRTGPASWPTATTCPLQGGTGRLDGHVLVDGLLRATWAARREGAATALTVRPSGPLSPPSRRRSRPRADALLGFIAAGREHRLGFGSS